MKKYFILVFGILVSSNLMANGIDCNKVNAHSFTAGCVIHMPGDRPASTVPLLTALPTLS